MGILDEIISKLRGQPVEPNFNVEPDGPPSQTIAQAPMINQGLIRNPEPFNVNAGLLSKLDKNPTSLKLSESEADNLIATVDEVLPGAKNLLKFTAKVESGYGENPQTLRKWNDPSAPSGYYTGGMMQIDPIGFDETKNTKAHPGLKKKYQKIKKELGIDWPSVKYEQLIDPLYSTIAARLLYSVVPSKAPQKFDINMAKYWKKHFNKAGSKGLSAIDALNNFQAGNP